MKFVLCKMVFSISVMLVLGGCKRTIDEQRLAKNYYALALAELGEPGNPLEQHKRSLLLLDQALTCDPKPHYRALRATLLFKVGLPVQSIALFKELLAESPHGVLRAEILNNYACVLAATNNSSEAMSIWRDLETDPTYLTPEVAFVNQGKLHSQNHEHEQALACFQKAFQLCPSYIDAHFYAAIEAHALGKLPQSASYARAVLEQEPDHQAARQLLAVVQSLPILHLC